jgi:hypothetical protein
MPIFKSTYNILKKSDQDEVFNPNWMDSDTLILPPKTDWDYQREMQIEDVNIWEVISDRGGQWGLYAAWDPYAEFYMIMPGWELLEKGWGAETYYGPNASDRAQKRMAELGMPVRSNTMWVDNDKMWLYQQPAPTKSIYIPSPLPTQSIYIPK